MEKLKRYVVFLIGLFVNSLGVALITKADLGTSPISSLSLIHIYVCAQSFERTMNNEATKPLSVTAHAWVRECK